MVNHLGKLLGGLAGLVSGKWPLVLFGLVLGHQFDRGFARKSDKRLPPHFVGVAFAAMGHLAKADGRVSEDEIRLARTAMHALNLDGEQTREAMRHFNNGKQPGFALREALQRLHEHSSNRHAVGRQLVQLLLPVLLIKDEASASERRILWQVCQTFEISRVELAQMEATARLDQRFTGNTAPRGHSHSDADRAFGVLALKPDASDQEIKTAYRRLMNRYHPDKLAGDNVDAAALSEAGRKTREIREAYELLRQRRGFR